MPFKPTIPTVCPTCGKNFLAPRPASGRQPTKFCSRSCAKESLAKTIKEKFWASVVKSESCWLWTGYRTDFGYGNFSHRGKSLLTHRVSWELHNGPIPKGKYVLHNCPDGDNPACVNPDHLWLGNQSANVKDMWQKGRGNAGGTHGEQHGMSKLSEAAVITLRKRRAAGESLHSLAREYRMARPTIKRAIYGDTWSHVPGALTRPAEHLPVPPSESP